MKSVRRDIENTRGDSFSFTVKVPLDVETDMWFSIKKNKLSPDYTVQKTIGNGISDETSEEDDVKWFVVSLSPSDTNELEFGDYYYDLQVKLDGEVMTPISGIFKVVSDVTRET